MRVTVPWFLSECRRQIRGRGPRKVAPNRPLIRLLVVFGLCLALAGCNRTYYRRKADQEVACAVQTATSDPRFDLMDFTIQPDPASRMYDPFPADCEPMPPDDPASHELMHCVDGKWGWKRWHRSGDTPYAENPDWRRYLPLNEKGVLVLDRQAAVDTALVHSREYQRNLEELYLSALTVTFERFRFDTQFFGGSALSLTADGAQRGPGGSQSVLRSDNTLRAERLMATGGELIVGLANSLVWQFSGPDQYNANTLLNFSLVQPLLRAGGRAVVLERLTDAERAMLAGIRQMEQYRRGFYVQTVAGRSAGSGPLRGGIGIGSLSPGGASASIGGFLGLLEEQVRIRNQRSNVAGLRASVEQMDAFFEAGRLRDRLQVDQIRQALYSAQSQLVASEANYQDRLDAYKITLGLPPDLEMLIADPLLRRFDLISPEMTELQENTDNLWARVRDTSQALPDDLPARLGSIRAAVPAREETVRDDLEKLKAAFPARRGNLAALAGREEIRVGNVEPRIYNVAELEKEIKTLESDLAEVMQGKREAGSADVLGAPKSVERAGLQGILKELRPLEEPGAARDAAQRNQLKYLLGELSRGLVGLSLIQARARVQTATLTQVDLSSADAFAIARDNRPDWMNARAALVDSWRQIEIAGNALMSDLNLTFSGDINTTDNNPVRFRSSTGRLRVGLEFDAPLTRVAERNAYRTAQIAYQQARRDYYAYEDRVNEGLRNTLREVRLTELDFELRRALVVVAANQVDFTRGKLTEPPVKGQAFSPTTARDLVSAYQGLVGAQNNFLDAWVRFEVLRMNLDFDLGTMRLDQSGMWIDPGPIDERFVANHKPSESGPAELPATLPAGDLTAPPPPPEAGPRSALPSEPPPVPKAI